MALSSERSFATKEELQAKAQMAKTLGFISGAMVAPLIAEEGIANIKGLGYTMNAAHKAGAPVKKEALRYLLRQGPKMAGYMAPLLAPALAARYFEERSKKL